MEIKRLHVSAAHRGHGHGYALPAARETTVVSAGADRAVPETGVDNHDAPALFHHAGFGPVAS
ncbi:GNAT family N-acetyltransferase [Embleya sp. NBC_00896]|uniref:GNAT family N-acetyltransferase n=1 Tax=Embleya sp. NBC_00896 TaxID=2975961 RepID=UPI00386F11E2|nr:GNAT family N-acetyltransferase [Embleya sp. NBC_00896]